MFFYSFEDGTTGLVAMGAIAKAAIGRELEYFGKVMTYFFYFHIEGAKAFDARSIDNVATVGNGKHLRESSGMGTFVVRVGNLGSLLNIFCQKRIDECGLAHS